MESWKGEREKRFEAEKGEKKLRHIFLYIIYRSDFITNEKDWLRLFS